MNPLEIAHRRIATKYLLAMSICRFIVKKHRVMCMRALAEEHIMFSAVNEAESTELMLQWWQNAVKSKMATVYICMHMNSHLVF